MRTMTEELDAEKWVDFFNGLAGRGAASLVAVEVIGERATDQGNGMQWPLQAIAYDPDGDVLEVAVAGRGAGSAVVLRHFIAEPRTIEVEDLGSLLPATILVDDASGVRTQIRLFRAPTAGAEGGSRVTCGAAGRRHRGLRRAPSLRSAEN